MPYWVVFRDGINELRFKLLIRYVKLLISPCRAVLFATIFRSFEAGIADAISSFK